MGRQLTSLVTMIVLAIVASSSSAGQPTRPIDVWLDVDTSTGISDVDDGLMLIQCFHSPELRIHGVSVVYGNAPLERAVPIAQDLVKRFGPPDLPVHAGAAQADHLGRDTPAVQALAQALRKSRLTILAVGPVTNVATLLQLHPQLRSQIERIVIVAARRPHQRFVVSSEQTKPFRDFNFENDPLAMQQLLDSDVPLVFAPWEVSSQVWLNREDLLHLSTSGASGRWIAESSQYWIEFWEREICDQGFNPFDTLAAGWLTHPHLVESIPVHVWIENGPDDRAVPTDAAVHPTKPYLLVGATPPPDRAARPALYCFRPQPKFKSVLLQRLAGSP